MIPPVTIYKNLLPESARQDLVNWFFEEDHYTDKRPDCVSKNPDWNLDDWPQQALKVTLDNVHDHPYEVEHINFFYNLTSRFGVHVDSGYGQNEQNLYQIIIMPLTVEGDIGTVFFKNYWANRCAKFTKKPFNRFSYNLRDINGELVHIQDLRELQQQYDQGQNVPFSRDVLDSLSDLINAREQLHGYHPRNLVINDYTSLQGYTGQPFNQDVYNRYLQHVDYEDLEGLEFDCYVPWVPGDVVVFPREQLHAASSGVLPKLGISIFTNRI